ncbi:MAG: DegV family protein [Oscillospiraceae bacterium]|jgi:DegV family protein with EDD domain|nr:DegV family protein [Oscillospiraceae bacterium]
MKKKRRVKFITDSGCDLPDGAEIQYNIDIMSFEIELDDVVYHEREDISYKEFYSKMNRSDSIPKTNQITVPRFEEKIRECVLAKHECVIMVLINSAGSQTYFNALKAKENLEKAGEIGDLRLYIIDSRTYSLGYGYPLVESVKKIDAGQSVEQVLAYLDDWFSCAEVYLFPLNLRHMKKSGRITAAAAFLGEIMGLKPIISLIDGVSEVLRKVRGEKAFLDEACKVVQSAAIPQTPWLCVCADDRDFYDKFAMKMSKAMGSLPAMESHLGCAVSTNTGPKVAAVVVKGKNRGKMPG